jgi:hypothetical protein
MATNEIEDLLSGMGRVREVPRTRPRSHLLNQDWEPRLEGRRLLPPERPRALPSDEIEALLEEGRRLFPPERPRVPTRQEPETPVDVPMPSNIQETCGICFTRPPIGHGSGLHDQTLAAHYCAPCLAAWVATNPTNPLTRNRIHHENTATIRRLIMTHDEVRKNTGAE